MRLISVNVARPRLCMWRGEPVSTGIFKEPVVGRVTLRTLNLDGDRQADLTVHGGPAKAVYAYPSEHYPFWRGELPGMDFPWGAFGENLTTEGLREDDVHIGDRFRAGGVELMVTQPRMPCFKLGIRFNRADMVKRFLRSGRTGFYVRVTREGEVAAGDAVKMTAQDERGITVTDIVALYESDGEDRGLLRRASELPALPESWREYFRERLAKPAA